MAITFDNPLTLSYMIYYNSVAGTYTARNVTSGDYFSDTATVGDMLYFDRNTSPWHDLSIIVGTPLVADSITIVWEFRTASGWSPLTVTDGTNNFTTTGTVAFDVPDNWRWLYRLDGATTAWSGFCIRARITAVTNLTEGGANSTNGVNVKDWAVTLNGGVAYTPADIQSASDTNGWGIMTTNSRLISFNANLNIEDTDTSFTVRSAMFEMGTTEKRRRIRTLAGTVFQLGYSNGSGSYYDSTMFRLWNDSAGGAPQTGFLGEVRIYNSILSADAGAANDCYYRSVVDMQQAVLETSASAVGNHYFQAASSGTIKNTSLSVNYRAYIYSPNIELDNLILTKADDILIGVNNVILKNVDFGSTKRLIGGNNNVTYRARDCIFTGVLNTQIVPNASTNKAILQFTVKLNIQDEDGNEITSPNVKVVNNVGTEYFNGEWTGDQVFDVWEKAYLTITDYNPVTLTISKAGYETYESTFSLLKPFDEIITLKPAIDVMITNKGPLLKANPANIGDDRELGIMP